MVIIVIVVHECIGVSAMVLLNQQWMKWEHWWSWQSEMVE
jgi:hypothetical protein